MKKLVVAVWLASCLLAGCTSAPQPKEEAKRKEPVTEETEVKEQSSLEDELKKKAQGYYDKAISEVKTTIGTDKAPGLSEDLLKEYIISQGEGKADAEQMLKLLNLDYKNEADKTVDVILELSAEQAGVAKDEIIEYSKKTPAIRRAVVTGLEGMKFPKDIIEKATSMLK